MGSLVVIPVPVTGITSAGATTSCEMDPGNERGMTGLHRPEELCSRQAYVRRSTATASTCAENTNWSTGVTRSSL